MSSAVAVIPGRSNTVISAPGMGVAMALKSTTSPSAVTSTGGGSPDEELSPPLLVPPLSAEPEATAVPEPSAPTVVPEPVVPPVLLAVPSPSPSPGAVSSPQPRAGTPTTNAITTSLPIFTPYLVA